MLIRYSVRAVDFAKGFVQHRALLQKKVKKIFGMYLILVLEKWFMPKWELVKRIRAN